MPIYEYTCLACEHKFELLQGIKDAPVKKCPACGKNRAQKKMSLAGFQLKGSGWYADGYSKEKPKATKDSATTKAEASAPAKTKEPAKEKNKT